VNNQPTELIDEVYQLINLDLMDELQWCAISIQIFFSLPWAKKSQSCLHRHLQPVFFWS